MLWTYSLRRGCESSWASAFFGCKVKTLQTTTRPVGGLHVECCHVVWRRLCELPWWPWTCLHCISSLCLHG